MGGKFLVLIIKKQLRASLWTTSHALAQGVPSLLASLPGGLLFTLQGLAQRAPPR